MFGRKRAIDRLREGKWRCRSCDLDHEGMFDLGTPAPWHWDGPAEPEPNAALRMHGDFLSDDLCVVDGRDFFVRGLLEIPVRGMAETFSFGCWSSLSRAHFEFYVENFDGIELDEPWTGWFASWPAPFPSSVNEPCWVEPQPSRARPLIWLENEDHPLAIAQQNGISVERLLEIYRANGHHPG